MSDPHWERVKELLYQALHQNPAARAAYLDDACGGDAALRAEVESLLMVDASAGSRFLDAPSRLPDLELGATSLGAAAAAAGGLEAGQRVAERYILLRRLGEGGMGQVWLAEQTEPVQREVALKLIKAGMYDVAVVQRFLAERQSLAIMDHPTIAKVFDAGTTPEGQPYFVMEYVPGLPITDYCDQHRLDITARLALLIQVCEGVQHAHQKALIHRDLKPANVLVVEVDGRPLPKIIDFGIAKAASPAGPGSPGAELTRFGLMLGTPGYMSPEQVNPGNQDIDTRTDVYSLGVILYVLLTGLQPFEIKRRELPPLDIWLRQLREDDAPTPSTKVSRDRQTAATAAEQRATLPRQLCSALRGDLDWIALKAVERDREHRYSSAAELAADLRRHLAHEPVLARPASAAYRARKYVRRHRVAVGVAAGLLVLLAGFTVLQAQELRRTTQERDRANRERDRATRIADFMVGMFKAVDPSEARGNTVTAREILDKGSKDIGNALSDDPELKARLIYTMGYTYLSLGLDADAKRLLQQSYALQLRTVGAESRETLQTAVVLNQLSKFEGNYPAAEQGFRDISANERRLFGAKDHDFLTTELQLADTLRLEGHAAESEKISREVLPQLREAVGPAAPETLMALDQLGNSLVDEERYAEADSVLRESLDIVRRTKGADDPEAMAISSQLINVLMFQNRYPEAEATARDNLKLHERVDGPDHPNTLNAKDHLDRVLVSQGRYAEAEPLVRELIAQDRKVFGDDRRQTLRAMEVLVYCLVPLGRLGEAETVARETWERKKRALGPEHPLTLDSLVNLGEVLLIEHKYGAAEKMEREVYAIRQRTLGPDRNQTFLAQCNIADAMSHQGKYAESRQLLETAYRRQLEVLPPINSSTARCRYVLASIAARTARHGEALILLSESVKAGLSPGDIKGLLQDEDFKSLRQNADFKKLIASALPPAGDK